MTEENFDDLRPYYDSEINAAMRRIVSNPLIDGVIAYLYPDAKSDDVKKMLWEINTTLDFQKKVMYFAVLNIVRKTITKFTCNGLENLDKNKSYLFVSNHRDILLDSALLQIALSDFGLNTSEITFGSNLMNHELVVDIGKINKMFKVERGGTLREMYTNSMHLSRYIRHTLINKNESVWIAQRNGRTKDGNDSTDQGIIKMFCMSSNKNIFENILELNIVPVAISYQWETCDVAKVRELSISEKGTYVKAPGEDLQSILNGITQFKGNVHIEVTKPLSEELLSDYKHCEKSELHNCIARIIDSRIHKNYKLWDNNYIANDIENNTNKYEGLFYSSESKHLFEKVMTEKLSAIEGDINELRKIYLGIYSNPVKNSLIGS